MQTAKVASEKSWVNLLREVSWADKVKSIRFAALADIHWRNWWVGYHHRNNISLCTGSRTASSSCWTWNSRNWICMGFKCDKKDKVIGWNDLKAIGNSTLGQILTCRRGSSGFYRCIGDFSRALVSCFGSLATWTKRGDSSPSLSMVRRKASPQVKRSLKFARLFTLTALNPGRMRSWSHV